jgi:hypothetical protein
MTTYAELSPEDKAVIDAETGGASQNSGFNLESHYAATRGSDTGDAPSTESTESAASSDSAAEESNGSSNQSTDTNTVGTSVDKSGMSEAVAELTDAQRVDLYAQVGDLIYNPGWNLAAHIAGNMEGGVFVAPSFELGKDGLNPNASLDWGSLAVELGIDIAPWESKTEAATALSDVDRTRLGDKLTKVQNISSEVARLSESLKADLYAQVGDAMYAKGFNLSAHIAANMHTGVFVPPSANSESALNDGATWTDWISTNDTALTVWAVNNVSVPVQSGQTSVLSMPAEGSEEWNALLEETAGASANPGFNYAAHIAAITSQNILTGVTEEDVLNLIKETGLTDFRNFDLDAHQALKESVATLTKNKLKGADTNLSADNAIFGSQSNDRIDLRQATDKKFIASGGGNDQILAGAANNVITAGTGNDFIDGGDGTDLVVIDGTFSDSTVSYDELLNEWIVVSNRDGTDTLNAVERVIFSDKSVAIDIDGTAGSAAKMLGALWGKESVQNPNYVGIVLDFLDSGFAYEDLLDLALGALFGENKTNDAVAELVYLNLIGEAPTEAMTKELASFMDSGAYTQAGFTRVVADLQINATNIDLVGLSNTGLQYVEYVA